MFDRIYRTTYNLIRIISTFFNCIGKYSFWRKNERSGFLIIIELNILGSGRALVEHYLCLNLCRNSFWILFCLRCQWSGIRIRNISDCSFFPKNIFQRNSIKQTNDSIQIACRSIQFELQIAYHLSLYFLCYRLLPTLGQNSTFCPKNLRM